MLKANIILKRFIHSIGKGDLLKELRDRGLVSQISEPESLLAQKLKQGEKVKMYCGVDPTAKSIHLGNLVPMMILLNFYVRGHDIVNVIGGATGRVGDPSGRMTERQQMADDIRSNNVEHISTQLKRFFQSGLTYYNRKRIDNFKHGEYSLRNNYEWWKDIKMLDFLAQYGSHIRIQSMLSRDSVSSRLGSKNSLGFNEFTYQILQAYDFFHLFENDGTSIQIGGNDQWGNITAGIDLIKRISTNSRKSPPFGITVPLLTTSNGQKFGKSAGNAIFIDPEINTAYDIYQFFYNTTDEDVPRFLKIFTLLPIDEIEKIVAKHSKSPHMRYGQTILAKEVTELIHGYEKSKNSELVSDIMFGNDIKEGLLSTSHLTDIFEGAGILKSYSKDTDLIHIIATLESCSNSDARRKISQGSIYLGISRTKISENITNWEPYILDSRILLVRIGKQKSFALKLD